MDAKKLKEMMRVAEEAHKYGPIERHLSQEARARLANIIFDESGVEFIGPPTAEDRARMDKLMNTSYGLP